MDAREDQGLPDLDRHIERQLRAQERQLVAMRFAVTLPIAAFLIAFRASVPALAPLLGLVAAVIVYNLAIALLVSRFPAREVGIVATALDMVAVTVAIYLVPAAIDAYLFYGLVILTVALRFGLGASIWVSLIVAFMYVSVVLAASEASAATVRDLLPVRAAYLIGMGLAAGFFSRIVIGRTLENARLQERLAQDARERAQARERELLSQLGRDFAYSLEREATVGAIVSGASPLLGDATWLYIVDEAEAELRLAAVEGRDAALVEALREQGAARTIHLGEGIPGRAAATATATDGGGEDPALPEEMALSAMLAVPVVSRGQVRGVLVTASRSGSVGDDQRRLAETIAERAGPALDNAALWADLQEQVSREQQAQRIKDDFLSIVSHELRTPLTSIQGYAQLLEGRLRAAEATNGKELSQLRVIRSQVRRMRRLVDDLLDVSRIDRRAGVTIEREPVDLAEELRDAVARAQRQHPDRQLTLAAPPTLPVVADRDRIGQVVTNLLDNAVKYSPDGGPVEVSAEVRGSEVLVSVADTGIGVPADDRNLVFGRFYQADEEASPRRFGGLGLGLYISRAIIEAHGGRISVDANAKAGRGSVFSFQIPTRPDPRQRAPILPEAGEPPAFVLRRPGGG
ncbi:MAG: ATP-binding protein [Chloroflexota bacterium]